MLDLSVAVAVITRHRPEVLCECLQHLRRQTITPTEIVVVDSSEDRRSQEVCSRFPEVTYVRFANGRNQMPTSRNLALMHSRAEVIAYVDDDSFVDPDWLEQLRETYLQNPEVAGIGGRISDKRWEYDPQSPVGRVEETGRVISNFFGDPGDVPEVDCLPGCNMSFRRDWLEAVGGVDPGFVCTNHREDPDVCWRIRQLGGILLYQPAAHALHLNARTTLGEMKWWHEFYLRYSFSRNDAYFVTKHFGRSPQALWRLLVSDSVGLFRWAWRNKSPIVFATIPLSFLAKGIGLWVGYGYRLKWRRGWRPDYYRQAAQQGQVSVVGATAGSDPTRALL